MKHYFKATIAFFCLFMVTVGANAEPLRVLKNAAGENFQKQFYEPAAVNGWIYEQGIKAERLGAIACEQAVNAKLVSKQDEQSCNKLFQQWNGLVGEFVSVDAFRAKAIGIGYWVGSIAEMQSPLVVPGTVVNKPATNVAVLELKGEVKNLSSRLGDSKIEESKLMGHIAKVSAEAETRDRNSRSFFKKGIENVTRLFENGIGNLKEELAGAQDEQVQAKVDAYAAKQKQVDDVQNLNINEANVNAAAALKKANGVEQKFVAVTEKVGRHGTATIVGFVLLLVAVILLAIKLWSVAKKLRKHENTLFGIPGKNGGKGTPGLTSLHGRVLELEDDVVAADNTFDRLEGEIGDLKQSHEQLIERVGRSFDEELIQPNKLKALPIGGRIEVALHHPHDEDNKVYLEVERSAEDRVTIHGTVRQLGKEAPVVVDSLAGVSSAINKAAKAGRIVGVLPTVIKANPLRIAA